MAHPDSEQRKEPSAQEHAGAEEQRARLQRYQALVEQEFLGGLTSKQAEEMERLGHEIDRYYDPFYKPIIERLEAKLHEPRDGR